MYQKLLCSFTVDDKVCIWVPLCAPVNNILPYLPLFLTVHSWCSCFPCPFDMETDTLVWWRQIYIVTGHQRISSTIPHSPSKKQVDWPWTAVRCWQLWSDGTGFVCLSQKDAGSLLQMKGMCLYIESFKCNILLYLKYNPLFSLNLHPYTYVIVAY